MRARPLAAIVAAFVGSLVLGLGAQQYFPPLSGPFPGTIATTVDAIGNGPATTPTGAGLTEQNTTLATAGVTEQWSPPIRMIGNAWASGGGVSTNVDCYEVLRAKTGSTAVGNLWINCRVGTGAYTQAVWQLQTVTGDVTNLGSQIIGASSSYSVNGKSILKATGDGLWQLSRNAGTAVGVEINMGTAAPTVANCSVGTTGTITTKSTNTTGEVNPGSGSTACDVVFGAPAFTNAPFPVITLEASAATPPYVSARSTTGFTVSGLTAGAKFTYVTLGGT